MRESFELSPKKCHVHRPVWCHIYFTLTHYIICPCSGLGKLPTRKISKQICWQVEDINKIETLYLNLTDFTTLIFVDGCVFVTMLEYSDFVSGSYNLIILFSYFCQKRIKQFKKIDMVWVYKNRSILVELCQIYIPQIRWTW